MQLQNFLNDQQNQLPTTYDQTSGTTLPYMEGKTNGNENSYIAVDRFNLEEKSIMNADI